MALPHFINTSHSHPFSLENVIYNSLFEIDFIFKTEIKDSYLEHHYFKYELSKNKLILSLYFNDSLELNNLIDSCNNLSEINIKLHDKFNITKYLFNLTNIKFIDFLFKQDFHNTNELTIIDLELEIN